MDDKHARTEPRSGQSEVPSQVTRLTKDEIAALPSGSWAAISTGDGRVLAVGPTQEVASQAAHRSGQVDFTVMRVGKDPDAPAQIQDPGTAAGES